MRIKIKLSSNKSAVPINNQTDINGWIHKCLGENNIYHDTVSNYCISMLCGGKADKDMKTLSFKDGGYIVVTSNDQIFLDTLINGLLDNTLFNYGMKFIGFEYISEQFENGWNHFATLSPFVIVRDKTLSGKDKYFKLDDEDFQLGVKESLLRKLNGINKTNKLDLNLSDFQVNIPKHSAHKVKRIYLRKKDKEVKIYANVCHISIKSNKKVIDILYNTGIGQSCGSGFGTIYKQENKYLYKF